MVVGTIPYQGWYHPIPELWNDGMIWYGTNYHIERRPVTNLVQVLFTSYIRE